MGRGRRRSPRPSREGTPDGRPESARPQHRVTMSTGSSDPVVVFGYLDYVCPFSYVAAARVRQLEEERSLTVYWRPLPIYESVPSDGLPVEQLGYAPDEWVELERDVTRQARELDLPLSMPDFIANSYEALQAAEFAKDVGTEAFRGCHRALFHAYFVENRNLGRREELLSVCEEAGLDRTALEEALEDGRYEEEIQRARSEAERYGIGGTPGFLFGRHKVVGAAPLEVLREAADRATRDVDGTASGEPGAVRPDASSPPGEPAARTAVRGEGPGDDAGGDGDRGEER